MLPENEKLEGKNRKKPIKIQLFPCSTTGQKELGFVQVFTDNKNHSFPKKTFSSYENI